MLNYQAMMGNVQDVEVLLAGLRRAVTDKEINGRALGPLRREVIDIYLAAADRLFDFEPEPSAGPAHPTQIL